MSFRRMPFQFTTTDPVERQRELERRFGLPSSRNMFVDVSNPLSTGAVPRDTSISSSSPRLQHRVPIFVDGYDHPIHSSVDSTGSTAESKKPNVRVIPIEVEGAESRPATARQRNFSGPAGIVKDHDARCPSEIPKTSPLKRSMEDLSSPLKIKTTPGPRVHNIPIQIEGANNAFKSPKLETVKTPQKVAPSPKINGCSVTKPIKVKSPGKENKKKDVDEQKAAVENSLKKIENVLEELKTYEAEIKEFNGNTKDKKYRYLDEMLTRCMIKLDDVETMGNESIRSSRKNAVKKIQAQIDLLESKANSANAVETAVAGKEEKSSETENKNVEEESKDKCETRNEVEMAEGQHVKSDSLNNTDNEVPSVETVTNGEMVEKSKDKPKIENQPDVETSSEIPEVEMAEVKSPTSENMDSKIGEIQEIEMTDSNVNQTVVEAEVLGEETKNEQQLTENQSVSEKTGDQLDAGTSSEIPEVEMADVKSPTSSDINSKVEEIQEIEMVDNKVNQAVVEPNVELPVEEIKNEQLTTPVTEDVEMKDEQSSLTDAKEKTVEKSEPDVNMEENTPKDNLSEISLNSNSVETSEDVTCDNNIKKSEL